ncbi:MAG: hypothetical protein WEC00_06255, partial [Dongiaceae bacterium]
ASSRHSNPRRAGPRLAFVAGIGRKPFSIWQPCPPVDRFPVLTFTRRHSTRIDVVLPLTLRIRTRVLEK